MDVLSVGFSKRSGNLLSSTICLLDNAPFSHVYIRRASKYGEYVYQASGLSVNFTNIEVFLKHNQIVEEYQFELDDEHKDALLSFFIKHCGKDYSVKTLGKLLLMTLGHRLGIEVKFDGDGQEAFICSELGALLCKEILEIQIPENEDFITPKRLHPYIVTHGKRII